MGLEIVKHWLDKIGDLLEKSADPRYLAARRLLAEYIREAKASHLSWWDRKPTQMKVWSEMESAEPVVQVALALIALERAVRSELGRQDFHTLLPELLRLPLTYTEEDILQATLLLSEPDYGVVYLTAFVPNLERHVAAVGLSPQLREALQNLRASQILYWRRYAEYRKAHERIDEILGYLSPNLPAPVEPWAGAVCGAIKAMTEEERTAWKNLFQFCETGKAGKPSQKWLTQAETLLNAVGRAAFVRRVADWFPHVAENASQPLDERNADFLKGLVWCCCLLDEAAVARSLGALAEAVFKKVPGIGLRSTRVGNACLYALGVMPGLEPVAQLARLQLRVKARQGQQAIGKAFEAAARRANLPREELEEVTVPDYGLDASGRLRETFGDFTAEAALTGNGLSNWRWITPEGKAQKSVPAAVKGEFAEAWKALKNTGDEIEKMLSAQRDRLDRLMRLERNWPLSVWRERYHAHSLMAGLSRRLIWHFTEGEQRDTGIWYEGGFVNAENRPLDWLTETTTVRLWHPIGFAPEAVLRWREWLEAREVTQPFKQAHREIYLLTDAELRTQTYSNRFAAHILKQPQFNALCEAKGWRFRLRLGFDGDYDDPATLELPQVGMQAQFWVEAADQNAFTNSGVFLYISTDQVRFCNAHGEALPLTEVPALIFSEVMRDVDMFVGVASIAADPNWQDQGADNRRRDYWHSVSFGELNASAATRRTVLARLLPRLKIASRCTLDGKFLIVRGDLKTYKIHLGSGNILMTPNDQYLCIVPDRSIGREGTAGLFLPFEGDQMLSVILSKAFLLADETRITDRTILSQLGRV